MANKHTVLRDTLGDTIPVVSTCWVLLSSLRRSRLPDSQRNFGLDGLLDTLSGQGGARVMELANDPSFLD